MIDHVGIYGSRVAEGLSAFNVALVIHCWREGPYMTIGHMGPFTRVERFLHLRLYENAGTESDGFLIWCA